MGAIKNPQDVNDGVQPIGQAISPGALIRTGSFTPVLPLAAVYIALFRCKWVGRGAGILVPSPAS